MKIDPARRKAIFNLYLKGESIETIILITGFSRKTITDIINVDSAKNPDAIRRRTFMTSWARTTASLRSISR